MKLILFNLFVTIVICSAQESSNGWIPIPERIPEEIKEEIRNVIKNNTINGRIRFGNRAQPGQFPFMGQLTMLIRGNWHFGCGSTLISRNAILSAAHCFSGDFWGSFSAIGVHFGSVDRHNMPIIRDGISLLKHPLWGRPGNAHLEYDISILRFNSPVYQTPAPLPTRSMRNSNFAGVELVTAGWGLMENGQYSQFLMYTRIFGVQCGTNFICTQGVGGRQADSGDSGGPLLTLGNTLVGVTSYKAASNNGYNGFTRVDRYLDWISSNTGIVIRN